MRKAPLRADRHRQVFAGLCRGRRGPPALFSLAASSPEDIAAIMYTRCVRACVCVCVTRVLPRVIYLLNYISLFSSLNTIYYLIGFLLQKYQQIVLIISEFFKYGVLLLVSKIRIDLVFLSTFHKGLGCYPFIS